jgi:hypothetical protein
MRVTWSVRRKLERLEKGSWKRGYTGHEPMNYTTKRWSRDPSPADCSSFNFNLVFKMRKTFGLPHLFITPTS